MPDKKLKTVEELDFYNPIVPVESSFLTEPFVKPRFQVHPSVDLREVNERIETFCPLLVPRPNPLNEIPSSISSSERDNMLRLNERRMCILMSKSFRVGWGANGVLVHSGIPIFKPEDSEEENVFMNEQELSPFKKSVENGVKFTSLVIEKLQIFPNEEQQTLRDFVPGLLQAHKECFFPFQQVQDSSSDDFLSKMEKKEGQSSYYKQIWSLCKILFGRVPLTEDSETNFPTDVTDKGQYFEKLLRKSLLSKWLEDVLSKNSGGETIQDVLQMLLQGPRQLPRIVDSLIKLKDFRLATIVTQMGSDEVREDLVSTVLLWQHNEYYKKIDKTLFAIYQLLAGFFSQKKREGLCEILGQEIDWKTRFGIHLWFNISHLKSKPTQRINRASPIETIFSSYDECRVHSLPPYLENQENLKKLSSEIDSNFPEDILFHILSLYSCQAKRVPMETPRFAKMFHYNTFTSSPLDYSVPWTLFTVLSGFPTSPLSTKCLPLFVQLSTNFASQLELLGMWEWSYYVLSYTLFYVHNSNKEELSLLLQSAISDLILRNAPQERSPLVSEVGKCFEALPLKDFRTVTSLLSFADEVYKKAEFSHESQMSKAPEMNDYFAQLHSKIVSFSW